MSEKTLRKIKVFLFDLDGTLVDSNEAHARAWAEVLAAEGYEVAFADIRAGIGMGSDHLLPNLIRVEALSDTGKHLIAKRDDLFKTAYLPSIKPFDGAVELLKELHARGFELVLASSGNANDIDAILKLCGLDSFFKNIVSSSEIENSKPNPDVVKTALEKAEADPDGAIMVGDTPYDVEAAKTAGLTTLAFTCGGWDAAALGKAEKVLAGPRDLLSHLDSVFLSLGAANEGGSARTVNLSEEEESEVEEHVSQRSPVIFEIIRRNGNEELMRPLLSLCSSGLAAGLSMGLSVLVQAFLREGLPSATWSPLISKLGYSVGFLVVILAHQQLFTENTLTAVVPLLAEFSRRKFLRVLRLWTTVLSANVVGAFAFSAFALYGGAFTPSLRQILIDLSRESLNYNWQDFLSRGIVAGFLVASLVWILANITYGKAGLIILMTYLLALMNLSHIVAGSVEASIALYSRILTVPDFFIFFGATLVGNILGGSALFAILSYAQIHAEID